MRGDGQRAPQASETQARPPGERIIKPPEVPPDEQERLRALRALSVLDTPAEERFDRITRLAVAVLEVPIALVSLVDDQRQWFKSACGLDASETSREVSFCGHAILQDHLFEVQDATLDDRFADNPLVTGDPKIRFYAGKPLRSPEGYRLGTFCVIDSKPRALTPAQRAVLQDLAAMAERELFALELATFTKRLAAANAEVEKSRRHLLAVLDQLRVGVLIVDEHGLPFFASHCCGTVLATGAGPMGATHWSDLVGLRPEGARAVQALMDLPREEREPVLAEVGLEDDRRRVEIDVCDDPRESSRRILFLYDVTELHRLRSAQSQAGLFGIVGGSLAMVEMYGQIQAVAAGDWTVLIEGETGTGKELVARAIHEASPRRSGPFVAVNCAGLSESLLGSQLFGHVRGAFTGALRDQPGVFEAASHGTLLLDEVGDMPAAVQTVLLRVLQEFEITRIGESKPIKVDVRVILATHRDLQAEIAAGRFREDLMYRIRVARIRVPPLRERREDIPILANAFLEACHSRNKTAARKFSDAALQHLLEYPWPGNVRELKSAIEHAALLCGETTVRVEHLPPELREEVAAPPPESTTLVRQDPSARILAALERAQGNRAEAARLLGIGRATLYRRMNKLGLNSLD